MWVEIGKFAHYVGPLTLKFLSMLALLPQQAQFSAESGMSKTHYQHTTQANLLRVT